MAPKKDFFEVILPAVGLLGVGILIGAGLGLILAPKAGWELRNELYDRYQKTLGSAQSAMRESGIGSSMSGSLGSSGSENRGEANLGSRSI